MSQAPAKQRENRASFMRRLKHKMRPSDIDLVMKAYDVSKEAHRNQWRDDGTRYFEHLRATAIILMDELGIFDPDLLIAALLHDIKEDKPRFSSSVMLSIIFSQRPIGVVDKVSKPSRNDPRFKTNEERHRFYFATVDEADVDTWIIKLADRLHNSRTLGNCDPSKIKRKIQETIDVYYPLAKKLAYYEPEIGKFFLEQLTALMEGYRQSPAPKKREEFES
jgi:guanosine-3',5'-bis(diphosphate) 3'-pyrophosphohydrolase